MWAPCMGIVGVEVEHEEARTGVAEFASPEIGEGSELAEGEDGELDEDEGAGGQLGEDVADPGAVEEDHEEAGDATEGSWRRGR